MAEVAAGFRQWKQLLFRGRVQDVGIEYGLSYLRTYKLQIED